MRFSTVSLARSAEKRGADVDFQAVWAHVHNQELHVSPRGASDWWRKSVRKSVSVHQDKMRGSAIYLFIISECHLFMKVLGSRGRCAEASVSHQLRNCKQRAAGGGGRRRLFIVLESGSGSLMESHAGWDLMPDAGMQRRGGPVAPKRDTCSAAEHSQNLRMLPSVLFCFFAAHRCVGSAMVLQKSGGREAFRECWRLGLDVC